jgi:P-type Cu+ transporter
MANMAKTTLKVEGMTCGACTSAVESGFKDVKGVGNVSVSLVMERAVVEHDPKAVTPEQIKDIIDDRGFDAEVLSTDLSVVPVSAADGPVISTTTLKVEGMTCGACTSAVEAGFKNVAGIKSISISLVTERAVVEHDAVTIKPEAIAEIIDDRGFDATVLETKEATTDTGAGAASKTQSSQVLTTTTIGIEGMTCGACTSAVESGFKDVEGLVQFNISLLAERAIIVHEPLKLSPDQIVEIIEDRGFDAKIINSQQGVVERSDDTATLSFKIFGLTDLNSANTLEESLQQMPGIKSCSVQFASTRATISHNPSEIGIRAVVEAIESLGFNALLAESEDNSAQLESLAKTREIKSWKRDFQVSLSFAIPVFLIGMIFPMYLPILDFGSLEIIPGLWLGDIVCLILTIPVQFGIGKRFYISAFKSLKHNSPTMDVLVVLGTSAAFFFSCIAMLVSFIDPQHTRPSTVFDTSSMLLTFITLGRFLENRAKGQTSKALSRLMSLAPSMATIYADPIAAEKAAEEWDAAPTTPNEKKGPSAEANKNASEEKVIPTELLQLGDICIIRPGDKIPADGLVTRGQSYIDESMVTGEAIPIVKKKGTQVMAGTVNGAGRLDFRVTRAGSDTQLSQIVKLVQEAQTSRAPIQRMADIVAGYFVPTIISLGLITFVFWMIMSHVLPDPPGIFLEPESGGRFMVCLKLCISVIVFACPCALGLSTPTAVMVGTGVGASNGILFKGGAALETATRIHHVVFDKTGTLTFGKMVVSNTSMTPLWEANDWRRRLWWTVIGLAEMSSEHPIGKAIVNRAKKELGLGSEDMIDGSVGEFEAVVGKGISVTVEPISSTERQRHRVMIGNPDFLVQEGIKLPGSLAPSTPLRSPMPITPRTPTLPKSPNIHKQAKKNAGTTDIHVAIDGTYAGTLNLSDTVKPSARATVLALRQMGVTASMVTGDQLPTALAIAQLVDIPPEDVFAGISPDNKQSIVKQIQASAPDSVVAMVGDGINDSPALATADVGIALSSGTDVAMEAADVVIMRPDDLLNVPAALSLSRTIFRRIKLNLGWACLYNLIGLPFAMGLGLWLPGHFMLPPMAAGAAMACSSVSVVGSSLLLKFWRRPRWMNVERIEAGADLSSGLQLAVVDDAMHGVSSLWRKLRALWAQGVPSRGGRGDYVPLTPVDGDGERRMSYGDV